ncbi:glycosyltransferase [Mesoplasma corruscae]|uniref:Glycosyltransferase n=1 Tax=Mesoplasma corruscae TaxID=216874 RepID=A0A2S5RHK3_9MOLU|nr:glycosyltransferase family 2 protein [Mesoplasma corruscae]PPE06768.1 glycosyltransferase [Mesoplasma corruscae]
MVVSFIISSQAKEERLFKTINTLKRQTNDSYELIIVIDEFNVAKESIDFIKDQFLDNDKISIILNSKGQGNGLNWNNGIKIVNGDYFCLLKEGDLIEHNFVEKIQEITSFQKEKLDIIEVQFEKKELIEAVTTPLLPTNTLYHPLKDSVIFAYVTQEIYGKIFRTKFIKDFRIQFKKSVRFDLLFLFMSLAHSKTFYLSDLVLFNHRTSPPKYSIFDMANQWPHILNYYRRIGIYKDYKEELVFAYHYNLCYLYLNLVKKIDNELTYNKSLKYVSDKINRKLKEFISTNIYLDSQLVPEFNERILNLHSFIKQEMSKK